MTTFIGQKAHNLDIFVNTLYLGYRLLEFRLIKWGALVKHRITTVYKT